MPFWFNICIIYPCFTLCFFLCRICAYSLPRCREGRNLQLPPPNMLPFIHRRENLSGPLLIVLRNHHMLKAALVVIAESSYAESSISSYCGAIINKIQMMFGGTTKADGIYLFLLALPWLNLFILHRPPISCLFGQCLLGKSFGPTQDKNNNDTRMDTLVVVVTCFYFTSTMN